MTRKRFQKLFRARYTEFYLLSWKLIGKRPQPPAGQGYKVIRDSHAKNYAEAWKALDKFLSV